MHLKLTVNTFSDLAGQRNCVQANQRDAVVVGARFALDESAGDYRDFYIYLLGEFKRGVDRAAGGYDVVKEAKAIA